MLEQSDRTALEAKPARERAEHVTKADTEEDWLSATRSAWRAFAWTLAAAVACLALLLVGVPDIASPTARAVGVVAVAGVLAFQVLETVRALRVYANARTILGLVRDDWRAYERFVADLEAARIQSIYDDD